LRERVPKNSQALADRTGSYEWRAISGTCTRLGDAEFTPGIHLGHAPGHLLLPGRGFLLHPVKKSPDFLAFLVGKPGELLFELEHGGGTHSENKLREP